ncbi:MAG TPA: hypothetical protein PKA64_26175, partial [Myxococcota bacterium]|nr:hypothetical protein [Myxococcota bacterium]
MTRVLPPIVGAESAVLRAIVVERRPLTPWHGPGLPPHVRAGSALAAWGDELLVVQDDTLAVARVPRGGGALGHLLLPLGP